MLCRSRQELVAVRGNFEGMLHQVPVNPQSSLLATSTVTQRTIGLKAALTSPKRGSQVTTYIYTKKRLASYTTVSLWITSLKSLV